MKTITWMIAGIALTLSSPQVGWTGDKAHGGDSCKQVLPILKSKMLETVRLQGKDAYPEFKFDVLEFFANNRSEIVVEENLLVDGVPVDARSFPEKNLIQVDRERFCNNAELRQLSILFHEYLVLMGLETTDDYRISKRFLQLVEKQAQEVEQKLNSKKYVCNLHYYYRVWNGWSEVIEYLSNTGYGSTREFAWNSSNLSSFEVTKIVREKYERIPRDIVLCNAVSIQTDKDGKRSFTCTQPGSMVDNCNLNQ